MTKAFFLNFEAKVLDVHWFLDSGKMTAWFPESLLFLFVVCCFCLLESIVSKQRILEEQTKAQVLQFVFIKGTL